MNSWKHIPFSKYLTEYWWSFSSLANSRVYFYSKGNAQAHSLSTPLHRNFKCTSDLNFSLLCIGNSLHFSSIFNQLHRNVHFHVCFHLNFKFLFLRCSKIDFVSIKLRVKQISVGTTPTGLVGKFIYALFIILQIDFTAHEFSRDQLRIFSCFFVPSNWLLLWLGRGKFTTNQTTRRQSQTSTEFFSWLKSFVNTNQDGIQIKSGTDRSGKLRGNDVPLFWYLLTR